MKEIIFTSKITVTPIQEMGGDHMVVAAARVSTDPQAALAAANDKEESQGLINYLMKHRHGTPFEHSSMSFYVHAPICVWREWHRHRIGFSYNEESGRYKQLDPVFYIPDRDRPMIPRPGFKSARPGFDLPTDDEYQELVAALKEGYTQAYRIYERLLGDGEIPRFDRGLARNILGVGIYSSCWVTCNPRSLMAFLSLRTHEPEASFVSYPLWEIEVAARSAEKILAASWPMTYKAFCDNGRVAP